MIAAFEGWNDAGEAASTALEHLELTWDATPLAAIDPEDYYDFQVTRPHVRLADGVTRRIEWQTTRLSVRSCRAPSGTSCSSTGSSRTCGGARSARSCSDYVERLGVTKVITLGALLTDTPHTRPTPVSGTSYDAVSASRAARGAHQLPGPDRDRRGLPERLRRGRDPGASRSGRPCRTTCRRPACPKAAVALLHRVEEVLDVEVPLGALPEQAEEWERTVSEMAEADDEVREYVRAARGAGRGVRGRRRPARPAATTIAADFERYLRRRGQGGGA